MNDDHGNDLRRVPAQRASSAAAAAATMMRMLDEIDYALVLVSGDGALRYANQLGLHELTAAGPLHFTNGFVRTRLATEQAALQRALGDAVRGLRRLITLGTAGTSEPLSVIPVPAEQDGDAPLALLVFGRKPARESLTIDFYARHHGLTGAETQVLKGLCAGLPPKEIAQRGAVAISTVRSHICSIRLKTQTSSIRDLVNRVASLPPITPAMKAIPPTAFETPPQPPPAAC